MIWCKPHVKFTTSVCRSSTSNECEISNDPKAGTEVPMLPCCPCSMLDLDSQPMCHICATVFPYAFGPLDAQHPSDCHSRCAVRMTDRMGDHSHFLLLQLPMPQCDNAANAQVPSAASGCRGLRRTLSDDLAGNVWLQND